MARYEVARQRDEYGGINWGSAFFGWLVAVGIAALLTALLSAAGTAIALSEVDSVGEAVASGETIGLVGGIALLCVALIAYFAGGYVGGRMSRFDGARQGVAVWLWGLIAALVLALIGAIAGSEYNLLGAIDLPRIPVDEGTLTTGGVILLVAVLLGTVLAAMAGGKAGERYHRRVDEVGFAAAQERARRPVEHRAAEHRDGERVPAAAVAPARVDRDGDGVDDRVERRRSPSLMDRLNPRSH